MATHEDFDNRRMYVSGVIYKWKSIHNEYFVGRNHERKAKQPCDIHMCFTHVTKTHLIMINPQNNLPRCPQHAAIDVTNTCLIMINPRNRFLHCPQHAASDAENIEYHRQHHSLQHVWTGWFVGAQHFQCPGGWQIVYHAVVSLPLGWGQNHTVPSIAVCCGQCGRLFWGLIIMRLVSVKWELIYVYVAEFLGFSFMIPINKYPLWILFLLYITHFF